MTVGSMAGIANLIIYAAVGGTTLFAAGALLPSWIAKPIIFGGFGLAFLFKLYKSTRESSPRTLDSDAGWMITLATVSVFAVGHIVRYGTTEFFKTMAAGVEARQASGQ